MIKSFILSALTLSHLWKKCISIIIKLSQGIVISEFQHSLPLITPQEIFKPISDKFFSFVHTKNSSLRLISSFLLSHQFRTHIKISFLSFSSSHTYIYHTVSMHDIKAYNAFLKFEHHMRISKVKWIRFYDGIDLLKKRM